MEKSKAEKRIRKALGLMPSTTFIKGKEGRKGGRKGRRKKDKECNRLQCQIQ
jgi:hypothetical protein